MSTLYQKAEELLNDKNTHLIPENIKEGVQIFDVVGNAKSNVFEFPVASDNDDSSITNVHIDNSGLSELDYIYFFEVSGNGFTNTNQQQDDTVCCSKIKFTCNKFTTVKLNILVNSEQSYDGLLIGDLDTPININEYDAHSQLSLQEGNDYSGSGIVFYTSGSCTETEFQFSKVATPGEHFFTLMYRKDGSVASGDESWVIPVDSCVVSFSDSPAITPSVRVGVYDIDKNYSYSTDCDFTIGLDTRLDENSAYIYDIQGKNGSITDKKYENSVWLINSNFESEDDFIATEWVVNGCQNGTLLVVPIDNHQCFYQKVKGELIKLSVETNEGEEE